VPEPQRTIIRTAPKAPVSSAATSSVPATSHGRMTLARRGARRGKRAATGSLLVAYPRAVACGGTTAGASVRPRASAAARSCTARGASARLSSARFPNARFVLTGGATDEPRRGAFAVASPAPRIGWSSADAASGATAGADGSSTGTRDATTAGAGSGAGSRPAATCATGAGSTRSGSVAVAGVGVAGAGSAAVAGTSAAGTATGTGSAGGGAGSATGAGAGSAAGAGAGGDSTTTGGASAAGAGTRAGKSASGSRYPCDSAAIRMPTWTYAWATSGSPLGPIAPIRAPSATSAPRETAIEPRCVSVTA